MSVLITNVSEHVDLRGPNQYIVRINNGPVIARFTHTRCEGLAVCLRLASEAVAASGNDPVPYMEPSHD